MKDWAGCPTSRQQGPARRAGLGTSPLGTSGQAWGLDSGLDLGTSVLQSRAGSAFIYVGGNRARGRAALGPACLSRPRCVPVGGVRALGPGGIRVCLAGRQAGRQTGRPSWERVRGDRALPRLQGCSPGLHLLLAVPATLRDWCCYNIVMAAGSELTNHHARADALRSLPCHQEGLSLTQMCPSRQSGLDQREGPGALGRRLSVGEGSAQVGHGGWG